MAVVAKPSPRATPVRRMLELSRPELARLLAGTLFLAVSSATALLVPQIIRRIIDQGLSPGTSSGVIDEAAASLVVVFLVQAVATTLRYSLFATAGERVVSRLRTELFRSLMDQDVALFDERRIGELTSRLSSDTGVIQNAVTGNVAMGLRYIATATGGIGFLIYTSPRLTLLMLAVVPPVALSAVAYGRRVRKLSRDVQDALARSSEIAQEALSGIRTVRSFAAEGIEVKRYSTAILAAFALARKRVLMAGTFMGVTTFAMFSASALVLWYGGHLVLEGGMTVGGLASFLLYTFVVSSAVSGLSDLWANMMRASGAATRVFDLLDCKPTIPPSYGLELARVDGRLEFQGVEFCYPARKDVPVLRGINLAVRPGEVIALVGPSGAGKSTIAALLMRLYDPDAGRILLDGHDLRELAPSWLRRQIGIVSQEPLLFSSSIADNIRYGRADAADEEVEAAARAANAHEFVATFPEGYRTLVGERGVQLSGGQKQRVAIARAVLKDPRLLVLDEATSALDAESEHLVKEALDRLRQGRTTLIIAHRLSTVIDADRVLVIDGGQIIQSGEHAALIGQDGMYRRLVERQFVSEGIAHGSLHPRPLPGSAGDP